MNELAQSLKSGVPLFSNEEQALLYVTLLQEGPLGAEKLHQKTGLHRETVQREIKKMEGAGVVSIRQSGRNKKAYPISISNLQDIIESKRENFDQLLKPLLTATANKKAPVIQVYNNNHAFGLLQLKLIKLQPKEHDIYVISTRPKEWIEAMIQSRKLSQFEKIRLQKEVRFLLSCFSELRGQVEHNNREYFTNQPEKLKRQYRYVETESSSPLQIQIWFNCIVISIFEAVPSIHIVIEDQRIVRAIKAYFDVLWSIGAR